MSITGEDSSPERILSHENVLVVGNVETAEADYCNEVSREAAGPADKTRTSIDISGDERGREMQQDAKLMPPPMSLPPLMLQRPITGRQRPEPERLPILCGPYPLQGCSRQANVQQVEVHQGLHRKRRRRNTGEIISPHDQSKFPSAQELWAKITKLEEEDCIDPAQPWGHVRANSPREPYVLDIEWFSGCHLVRARLLQLQDVVNAPDGRRLALLRTSAIMTDAAQRDFNLRKRVLWGFAKMMDRYRRYLIDRLFFVRTATLILEPIVLAKEDYFPLQRRIEEYTFCIIKLHEKPEWKVDDLDDASVIRAIMEMDNLIDTDSLMDTRLLDPRDSSVMPGAMAAARLHGQFVEVHPDIAAVRIMAGLNADAEDPLEGPSPKKETDSVGTVDNVNLAIAKVETTAEAHPTNVWRIN